MFRQMKPLAFLFSIIVMIGWTHPLFSQTTDQPMSEETLPKKMAPRESPDQAPWPRTARRAENMNLSQLAESILIRDQDFNEIVVITAGNQRPIDRYEFRPVALDPRVARMVRLLQEMDAAAASRKTLSIFREAMSKLRTLTLQRASKGVSGQTEQHGITAAAFLCSQFCDKQQFDDCMVQWMAWQRSQHRHFPDGMSRNEWLLHNDRVFSYERKVGPNPPCVLNLYYFALLKNGMEKEEILDRYKDILAAYETPMPLIDDQPLHDQRGTLMTLPVMHHVKGALMFHDSRRTKQLEIVQQVRELLNPPSAVQEVVKEAANRSAEAINQVQQDWVKLLRDQGILPAKDE